MALTPEEERTREYLKKTKMKKHYVMEKREKIDREKLTISLPSKLLKLFRGYCKENALKMSGKIAILIREELKQNQEKNG